MKNLKQTLFVLLSSLLLAATVRADQLSFTWAPYDDPAATGLRIYQDSSSDPPVAELETTATTATIEAPAEGCHNFWMVAFNDVAVSPNSDVLTWCPGQEPDPDPPEQPPVSVGGFTVRVIVEPNQ